MTGLFVGGRDELKSTKSNGIVLSSDFTYLVCFRIYCHLGNDRLLQIMMMMVIMVNSILLIIIFALTFLLNYDDVADNYEENGDL